MGTTKISAVGREYRTNDFDRQVESKPGAGLRAAGQISTVQINIGLTCNLVCTHCHVNSSPQRKEQMDWPTLEAVLTLAAALDANTIDITGGAPEMNPHFRDFVAAARDRGFSVMVRTNLTIALQSGYEDLPEFFRDHGVRLVASLPCYLEENVNQQRGEGVYSESIDVIRRLNELGYGRSDELELHLVYNPLGDSLPPPQANLEVDYKRELKDRFGIVFTSLFTITNIPIGRFRTDLKRQGKLDSYLETLRNALNPHTIEPLMCRHQIHVGWDGSLYDCDFNFALGMPAHGAMNVRDVNPAELPGRRVATGRHCYACTAGAGSSCSGALI